MRRTVVEVQPTTRAADLPEYLTIQQAACYTQQSEWTIRQGVKRIGFRTGTSASRRSTSTHVLRGVAAGDDVKAYALAFEFPLTRDITVSSEDEGGKALSFPASS